MIDKLLKISVAIVVIPKMSICVLTIDSTPIVLNSLVFSLERSTKNGYRQLEKNNKREKGESKGKKAWKKLNEGFGNHKNVAASNLK